MYELCRFSEKLNKKCQFTLHIFSVSSMFWSKKAIFWVKILQNRYHSLRITLSCYTSLKAEFWVDFEFLRVKAWKRTQKIELCFNLEKKFWYELFACSSPQDARRVKAFVCKISKLLGVSTSVLLYVYWNKIFQAFPESRNDGRFKLIKIFGSQTRSNDKANNFERFEI